MARVRSLCLVLVWSALVLGAPVVAAAPAGKAPATTPAKPTTPAKDPATTPAKDPATTPKPETPTDPIEPPPTTEPEPVEPIPDEPEPPPTAEDPAVVHPDAAAVAALQQEARLLRDELFKARGRVSLVAAKLFTTRISLRLRSNLERFYSVSNLTLRIDGAPVYVQDKGMPTTDADLFEVYAAPGSHELSVSADLVARRDATYKIRFDHTVVLTVDANERVSTRLLLRETGNMWRFAQSKRGRTDMRTRLRAQAKSTVKGKAKGKASVAVGGGTK